MLSEERFKKIITYLRQNRTASITELEAYLETSDSTVRRDIKALDKAGKLKRVRGGAVAIDYEMSFEEPSVEAKEKLFVEEKTRIGRYAASTLRRNDFIFIDAGTTTAKMIDFITDKSVTVVTNAFSHAKLLAAKGIKVYILGGQIKTATEAIVGTECIDAMQKYNFTKCYVGTNGISLTAGFTTPDSDEARVKAEAVKRSYVTYVLADHSKFDMVSPVKFAELEKCCILTDAVKNPRYEKKCVIKQVG